MDIAERLKMALERIEQLEQELRLANESSEWLKVRCWRRLRMVRPDCFEDLPPCSFSDPPADP